MTRVVNIYSYNSIHLENRSRTTTRVSEKALTRIVDVDISLYTYRTSEEEQGCIPAATARKQ